MIIRADQIDWDWFTEICISVMWSIQMIIRADQIDWDWFTEICISDVINTDDY